MKKKKVARAENLVKDRFTEVELKLLKDHPRNYKTHPDGQLQHIVESIKDHGVYKNIVVAKDNTILAGHGVVKAARKMKMARIIVARLNLAPNSRKALKILAGDNEISRLGIVDDRSLAEILKEIKADDDLLGTGFDEKSLSHLTFMTREDGEIDPYKEWAGMPEFVNVDKNSFRFVIVHFKEQKHLDLFAKLVEQTFTDKTKSIWFPEQEKMKTESKRY